MILEDIKTVLVIKLDHVGDVILSTPVYQAIKQTYPNSFLRVVVGPWAKSVLKNNPFVDEIIEYAAPWLDYNGFYETKDCGKAIQRAITRILSRPNDLVINLRDKDPYHQLFCIQFKENHLLSFDAEDPLDKFSNRLAKSKKLHALDKNKVLLSSIGITVSQSPKIYFDDHDRLKIHQLISSVNVRVAIFPGAGVPWKKWPRENFIKICERLNELNISPIIIGHSSEADFSKFIDNKAQVIDLIGKTNTIQELAALLSQCNVLLSNDSAPVHVAESVDTKCVVITKPNSLSEFGLRSSGNIVLGKKKCLQGVGCPSFILKNERDLPKSCYCINSIGLDTVEKALLRLLKNELNS
jgi:ADP-heptose:LPS heptosyltransferase